MAFEIRSVAVRASMPSRRYAVRLADLDALPHVDVIVIAARRRSVEDLPAFSNEA